MKKLIKPFTHWIFIGLGFIFVLAVSYFVIKARSTTNPWLSEPSPVGGLYVNTNETLNAAKRNTLVSEISTLSWQVNWAWTDCNTSCTITTPTQWKFFSWRTNWYSKIWKTVCFNLDLYDVNNWSTSRTLGWWTTMISWLPPAKKTTFGWTAVASSTSSINYPCLYSITTSWQYVAYCWNVSVVWLNSSGCYEAQ